MIRLVEVTEQHRALLWSMLQDYLREMSAYYQIEVDEAGNYRYKYFDAYFTDKERKALLICSDDAIVGFALINTHSYIGENPDFVLAEFAIQPAYRKKNIGSEAVMEIFSRYQGDWELKYSNCNAGAKHMWEKITAVWHPKVHCMDDDETVRSFSTNE